MWLLSGYNFVYFYDELGFKCYDQYIVLWFSLIISISCTLSKAAIFMFQCFNEECSYEKYTMKHGYGHGYRTRHGHRHADTATNLRKLIISM
jgi:hypothetical protein